ncbi:MAG: ribonuclease PH [Chloroflexi bacterium]|nr:ribonuclease PH [Chloroflexota bacterium]
MSSEINRFDGRAINECRPITIEPGFMPNAEGSALVRLGDTHVICTATVELDVPRWMRGRGTGWVTAEYGMLPRSTDQRIDRRRASTSGRSREIERLIGRSLRAITDMAALGECSITIDCDVLRADGGTRTASITGGYVALEQAIKSLQHKRGEDNRVLTDTVAAISVGIVDGRCVLDLPYEEDSRAEVDMNVVMTGSGDYVEIQGTAEAEPFTAIQLQEMLDLARIGCDSMKNEQLDALVRGAESIT